MKMPTVYKLLVLLAALASPGFAQSVSALSFQDALQLSLKQLPSITVARAQLAQAQATLTEAQANPASLVLALTQAQQSASEAQASLTQAQLVAANGLAQAWAGWTSTTDKLKITQAQLMLDRSKLKADQARLSVGYATALTVAQDQNTVQRDQLASAQAKQDLQQAKLQLAAALGQDRSPASIKPAVAPSPQLELVNLQKLAAEHALSVIKARDTVRLAELQLKLAQNDYSTASAQQNAQTTLLTAKANLVAAGRSASLSVAQAYQGWADATASIQTAKNNAQTAKQQLKTVQAQLQAGVVTPIQVEAAQLTVIQAEAALNNAQASRLTALTSLNVAVSGDVADILPGKQP